MQNSEDKKPAKKSKVRPSDLDPNWRHKPRKPAVLKKSVNMTIRLTPNEFDLIADLAGEYQMSRSELIVKAVKSVCSKKSLED